MPISFSPAVPAPRAARAASVRGARVARVAARCARRAHHCAARAPTAPGLFGRARFVEDAGASFEYRGASARGARGARRAAAPGVAGDASRGDEDTALRLPTDTSEPETSDLEPRDGVRSRSVLGAAGAVGALALACKALGLLREAVVAARFGVGWVADAHAHASTLPVFFFVAVGGLNGPLHSVFASVFASGRRTEDDALQTRRAKTRSAEPEALTRFERDALATSVAFAALCVGAVAFVAADAVARVTSPGLPPEMYATVAAQLRIMAPCIPLAAVNGVFMAKLTVFGRLATPVASPAISSLCVIVCVAVATSGWLPLLAESCAAPELLSALLPRPEHALAVGTTLGALAQCAALKREVSRLGPGAATLGGDFAFARMAKRSGERKMSSVSPAQRSARATLADACATSATHQLASCTDLFFASFVASAAAGLGYATLLAMTPLGILSTALVTPLVPVFDKNKHPNKWHALRLNVSSALAAAFAATAFVAAVATPLAAPAIRVAFERDAFGADATALVATAFATYVIGGFFFVARELITRVFYVLGDAAAPLKIATASVFVNAALDVAFVLAFGLGARGIALATVGTAAVAAAALQRALARKIGGGGDARLAAHCAKSALAAVAAFCATESARAATEGFARTGFWEAGAALALAAASGAVAFAGVAFALRLENPLSRASLLS